MSKCKNCGDNVMDGTTACFACGFGLEDEFFGFEPEDEFRSFEPEEEGVMGMYRGGEVWE